VLSISRETSRASAWKTANAGCTGRCTPNTREGELESLHVEKCTRWALGSGSPPSHNDVEKITLLRSCLLLFFDLFSGLCSAVEKGNDFVPGRQKGLHFRGFRCAVSSPYDCCTMQRKSHGRVGDNPTKKYEKKISTTTHSWFHVVLRRRSKKKKSKVVQRIVHVRLVEPRSKIVGRAF
jgi:hypothetical protein